MLVCAFEAAHFILAEFNHMIKLKALVALHDTTALFKQFTKAFLIQV